MRITFVITGLGMGGAEVQVCTLAAGWLRRGASVHIVSMLPKIAKHPQLSAGSIPVSTLQMTRGRWTPGDLVRYVKTARADHPDIVHSHLFHANLLARIGRPFIHAPLVCTVHNIAESPEHAKRAPVRTRIRELAMQFSDPLCQLTTQVSAEGAKRYVAIRATPAAKMQFVPNAVDCERFRPNPDLRRRIREELRLGELFTWIWIGRMEEEKGPWTLLNAFRLAASAAPCVLLVVGSGALEKQMRERATTLGIASRVQFLGVRGDIPALLNGADGYVLSSDREGFPMVLLEAAASGLPLVITSAGGAAELVIPDKSGWVVRTGDPDALAERMRALMALSPDRRSAMGEEGRNFVASRFALDAVLNTWEHVYASLLEKKRFGTNRVRSSI